MVMIEGKEKKIKCLERKEKEKENEKSMVMSRGWRGRDNDRK